MALGWSGWCVRAASNCFRAVKGEVGEVRDSER